MSAHRSTPRAPHLPEHWEPHFATFTEEGIFDIDTGKWTLFNPRCRSLDIQTAFGMSDAKLGKRVVNFAHEVSKGWRPKK